MVFITEENEEEIKQCDPLASFEVLYDYDKRVLTLVFDKTSDAEQLIGAINFSFKHDDSDKAYKYELNKIFI